MIRPRIADMVTIAARLSRTPEADIVGERRFIYLCAIRHAVYATAREWGYSYPAIGKVVGNRDHTSVLNSIRSKDRLALQFKNLDSFCEEVSRWADELPPFVNETAWQPPKTFRITMSAEARRKRDRDNARRARIRKQRLAAKYGHKPKRAARPVKPAQVEKAPDAQYMRMVHSGMERGSANLLEALRAAA